MLARHFSQDTLDNIIAEVRRHLPEAQDVEVQEVNQTIHGGRIKVVVDGDNYTLSSDWPLDTVLVKLESLDDKPYTDITKTSR